jgi:uncharacterized protein
MWIHRDFEDFLKKMRLETSHPIKVLKGPRQVGKTSILERIGPYHLVPLDDFQIRQRATENPRLFLDQFTGPLILDEATQAPSLFLELKRRVDDYRRRERKGEVCQPIDVWITGSNQTLLEKAVQESLAGRASYFDLNTLSLHELNRFDPKEIFLRGGWPELYALKELNVSDYLNDLISTFVEKDIVVAAGIERKSAFSSMISLLSGRIGQLFNASDIARNTGVETTTIQSWVGKLEQNALVRTLQPYYSNLNQRLIKSPKIYFEDVGFASRFQGWTEFQPLYLSPYFGHLVENLALIEIARFFQNNGKRPELFFLRSKEKVEIDFLIKLPNNRWIAAEVKTTPMDFTEKQIQLLESVRLNVIAKWTLSLVDDKFDLKNSLVLPFTQIFSELRRHL